MAKKALPSPELLRQLLGYDPETGRLWWKPRPVEMFSSMGSWRSWHSRCMGIEAFTAVRDSGYLVGNVFGQNLRAHRVIWAMVHGSWPEMDIDHINGDRRDNRLCNLRSVTRSENLKNLSMRTDNTSGFMGVMMVRKTGKWRAFIEVGGSSKSLGEYASIADAIEARKSAEMRYGFHQNHGKARRP